MTTPDFSRLETELRRKISGDVYFDEVTRYLYSTDASLYEIQPVGVVVARNKEDVLQAIRTAAKYGVSILPRGAGTSIAGQAVGHSLVIDCSKFMNRILELNPVERWVRVEPGIVRDELNAQIRPTGLHFAPETATSNRANIGGMIANNSSGMRSIVYGKTVDHVLELRAILANGEEVLFRELSPAAYDAKCRQQDFEGRIYREVRRIVQTHESEIRARFPKVMRRVGGYNLDELLGRENWNLSKILTGSEGTLAYIVEARLKLEPVPKATALLVVHFADLIESLHAVATILPHQPAAVELLDRTLIDLAHNNLEIGKLCTFVEGKPQALLLVEFFGASQEEAREKVAAMETNLRQSGFGYAYVPAILPELQTRIWSVRRAGLGILQGMKGDFKPVAFIEDACVPTEALPEYLTRIIELVRSCDRRLTIYGHASVGVLHIRPFLNLKQQEDVEILRRLSEEVFKLVVRYGGAWSGEHGDGLVRSYLNEKFFGPRLYQAFRELKQAFDPFGLMNPGKIVDSQNIDENLRIGPAYKTREPVTYFRFAEDGGISRAVEMCTGVGACRKTLTGTMCPSYMVTRDEQHSTRGRANALRAALTGKISTQNFTTPRLKEVFDLCLACKGCKAECPSNVDMAKLKYEFLAHFYDEHGTPISVRLFSRPDLLGPFGSRFATVTNALLQNRGVRKFLEISLGLDHRRILPFYAKQSFPNWFKQHHRFHSQEAHDKNSVVLFNDTFMNYHDPEIGQAAVKVLEALGYHVILANAGCCGRPQISNGLLRAARPKAEAVVRKLHQFVQQGYPIVGCEPGCISAIKEDYLDLVRNPQEARAVAENFLLIEDFVLQHVERFGLPAIFHQLRSPVLYHGHCHHQALFGTVISRTVLTKLLGCAVEEIDTGCCGMAGVFGYEKRNYDLSMKIGERRLFPAVLAAGADHRLVANGFSCRHQIEHATGRKARHVIQILAEALDGSS
ncbi:MAG: FAD-binding protein [candidate division KSB1 bacterium]|nr:FAD-binding protein [candidate division KSB1 bacterium]MDZ7303355.1 FAD-binding protein [candidate division KSB1 bacterium]MDZ7312327.1 FAD-binding protein [candidate division KSB1 bacterium]